MRVTTRIRGVAGPARSRLTISYVAVLHSVVVCDS
jgi:hypothetical protein